MKLREELTYCNQQEKQVEEELELVVLKNRQEGEDVIAHVFDLVSYVVFGLDFAVNVNVTGTSLNRGEGPVTHRVAAVHVLFCFRCLSFIWGID